MLFLIIHNSKIHFYLLLFVERDNFRIVVTRNGKPAVKLFDEFSFLSSYFNFICRTSVVMK
jgi:hypothetical protein